MSSLTYEPPKSKFHTNAPTPPFPLSLFLSIDHA